MSRIGKKPVALAKGVKIDVKDGVIKVEGPKGKLEQKLRGDIAIKVEGDAVKVERGNDEKQTRALHGLYRALMNNMITGVSQGFSRKLELVGVGYKAELKSNYVILSLGYSHPIYFRPPEGVKIEVPSPTNITISGIDKELVGGVAAKIRSFRKPEPYKGKGVKYEGEVIRRKEGKTAGK
ncbi:MAG: 50S ribosomal protein L6 [[Candidatus Thermochlorobacteriaceae] bacterium GBChlB]|nr:MAG: 50S ribosomal protein L6 [[Candidatus Thermochlorobacteriaceae] bacterium GBChlB]